MELIIFTICITFIITIFIFGIQRFNFLMKKMDSQFKFVISEYKKLEFILKENNDFSEFKNEKWKIVDILEKKCICIFENQVNHEQIKIKVSEIRIYFDVVK